MWYKFKPKEGIATRGVPIYQIGKISAAQYGKFSISAIGIFLKLYQYFYRYSSTNWLILLMLSPFFTVLIITLQVLLLFCCC